MPLDPPDRGGAGGKGWSCARACSARMEISMLNKLLGATARGVVLAGGLTMTAQAQAQDDPACRDGDDTYDLECGRNAEASGSRPMKARSAPAPVCASAGSGRRRQARVCRHVRPAPNRFGLGQKRERPPRRSGRPFVCKGMKLSGGCSVERDADAACPTCLCPALLSGLGL